MNDHVWELETGDGPLVAAAIHDGHDLREEVAGLMAITDADRLHEEDPFTGEWTRVAAIRMVGLRSRFEVDLNRPRQTAVYRRPEDAWGLRVWRREPPREVVERSRAEHDAFYAAMRDLLTGISRRHGRFVVLDLHSYNHRRQGPGGPPADEAGNPQVNLGTGTMDRGRWSKVVDRFLADLRGFPFPGGGLDVRENVKFRGGYLSRWVHETFPETGCALAVEFKKFFMDEWTAEPDRHLLWSIREALRSTVPGILEGLQQT